MDAKLARLTNYFLGYYDLNLIQLGHFTDEFSPKTPIDEHALDLLQQRMVPDTGPPGQRTLTVMNSGRQHPRGEGSPGRIDEHKPFAPLD